MAKAIMIQGTMSNAGKSLIAAGLCRVFHEDGYRVAPFKSQNMALNSFITKEGLEMGRAQVVQAEAAGVEPSVLMNPILLKPTTDMGSQVIVNGKSVGNYNAVDYYKKKKDLIPIVRETYEKLAAKNDIIVIEGAGSPAEINLRENDFVNMGMAKIADAPVLLVGDIDRGGVFAQLLGTVELLEEDERERIRGVIINKFRGDEKILEPGLKLLEDRIHKPVLGVMPYIDVHLEDEDSLSADLDMRQRKSGIDLAVIRLPRISNFTDFQVFSMEQAVSVRYVTNVRELGNPDAVILPGTKSTIADLMWLRESGLEARILRLASKGTVVFGICGGYQMLGKSISDPEGAETSALPDYAHRIRGMGLLDTETVFHKNKTMTQEEGTAGKFVKGPLPTELAESHVCGYEIHMGQTRPVTVTENESPLESGKNAWEVKKQQVFGTYLHGIFDNTSFRRAFLTFLGKKKGIQIDLDKNENSVTYKDYREEQYRHLAKEVRKHLDMKQIYAILKSN